MSKNLKISVKTNGPLKITGDNIQIRYCGEPLEVSGRDTIYLCRCGNSKQPPLCDGSHNQGFVADDPKGATRDVRVWEGKTITTYFNPNVCMHAAYCKPLKALRERELGGDAQAAEEIARIIQTCPSGALTFEANDLAPEDFADDDGVDIDVIEGGEVRIKCGFTINAEPGENQPDDRATLCRCGLSKNKPWCDGAHKKREGFK